jgi:tRNA-binding protein
MGPRPRTRYSEGWKIVPVVEARTAFDADIRGEEREGMNQIGWDDFAKVELRVGRVITAEPFPAARKPAYQLVIDFGEAIGVKKSSAQLTGLYRPDELVGKLVVAVVNFPAKQIGPFKSECLVTGFPDENGNVALCIPDKAVPIGAKLF